MAFPTLRSLIDLVEGKKKGPQQERPDWRVAPSNIFAESVISTMKVFPDIKGRIAKFIETKMPNPLDPHARYGKHDRIMTADLQGYQHCHLRDDAILIYDLKDRTLILIAVVSHADIEGKRLKQTAKRIRDYRVTNDPIS